MSEGNGSTITQRTGVSIALVVLIVGGIVSNVAMMFSLRSDVAVQGRDVQHLVKQSDAIAGALTKLTDESRSEIRDLRSEAQERRNEIERELIEVRARLLEAEKLGRDLAELRARIMELEKQ